MATLFTSQPANSNSFNTAELNNLLDCVGDAAFLIQDQQIVAVNAKATELTAYTRKELENKSIGEVVLFGKETGELLAKRVYTDALPTVTLFTRNQTKIPSFARTTPINSRRRLITITPLKTPVNANQDNESSNILSTIQELIFAQQTSSLEKAISTTLEISLKLLEASVLAIYIGNSQKPSAARIACIGMENVFPVEIFSSDLDQFQKPAIWIREERSIITFLHQGARTAGFSYLATYPIGEAGAIIGVLVAGGYIDPVPENYLLILKIIGGFLSNIINKSTLIANLQKNVKENIQNISILESAKNVISDGIIIVTPSLTIGEMNQAAEVILGFANHEVKGLEVSEVFVGTDRLIPAIQLAFQGVTTPNLGDVNLHRRDGSEFPADISTIPIQHKTNTMGVFIILRDKSESEQIRIRTHQLEQRALLGEVTAVFAHEVRNPINNISTGLQLMAEDIDEKDPNHELTRRMLQDCSRLTDLMESVLTFSRSGSYSFAPLVLGDLLKRLVKFWTPRMNRLKIDLHINIPSQRIMVQGDKRSLEQVFTNLISNSIQAMQEMGHGTLAIKMSKNVNGNGRSFVQVDISDTGPGIPDESRHRIFEPFFTTKKNGTGLGLAITKQIVTAHKGSIHLTSFPGGTVFHVKLPALNEME